MYVFGGGVSTIICTLCTFSFAKSVIGPTNDIASWCGFRHRSSIYISFMYRKNIYNPTCILGIVHGDTSTHERDDSYFQE